MNKLLLAVLISAPCLSVYADNKSPNNDCGRLVTGHTYTKAAQNRFHGNSSIAVVTELNGNPVIRGKSRFKLPIGRNIIKVGHVLNDNPINNEFTLNVSPDTSYYIAYAHNAEWLERGQMKRIYSGPIITKEIRQNCR